MKFLQEVSWKPPGSPQGQEAPLEASQGQEAPQEAPIGFYVVVCNSWFVDCMWTVRPNNPIFHSV